MELESTAHVFAEIAGTNNVRLNEPMSSHTSFKVGGPADLFVTPDSIEKLLEVYSICIREKLPVFIMGNGTNLIVRDGGIRGVVIKIYDNLSKYEIVGDTIRAEAGILLSRLSKIALKNGLSGLEFAEGIPGTLGGAVAMNAGAYTGVMADVVSSSVYMDRNCRKIMLGKEQHCFGKRSSHIQSEGGLIVRTDLKLEKGDRETIKAQMDDFGRQRREKQPLELPSAGSIFKRPEGHFTGMLVQDCGLKGHKIGGAEVSCKHCGFIVNAGNASAADVEALIEHIQQTVRKAFGVWLQTEVKIVGEYMRSR